MINEDHPDNTPKVRTFIGFGLPPAAAAEAAQRLKRLRAAWGDERVGWGDPAHFHITLVFLGELDGPRLGEAQRLLREVATRLPPVMLTLGRTDAFPHPRRPRVLMLRIGDESRRLTDIHSTLVAAYAPFGYRPDHPVFSPHVTLGYVQHPGEETPRPEAGEERPVSWRADRISLYVGHRSELGLVYLPVDTRAMGG